MKYICSEDIGTKVSEICELLSKAQTPDKWIVKISSYIFEYWDAQPEIVEQFATLIKNPKLRRESMALADRIYNKGVIEGASAERLQMAWRLLQKGMGVEEVLEITHVTIKDFEDGGLIPG